MSYANENQTANLFFFRTEIEALCSCQITNNKTKNEKNFLFASQQVPFNIAKKLTTFPVMMLKNSAKSFFARTREIINHRDVIRSKIGSPNKIVIHVSRLLNSTVNFYIYDLIKQNPLAIVVVHIIPHGINSQRVMPLSYKNKLDVFFKKYSRIIFGLSFFDKINDKYGFTSSITEKIYAIPGLEQTIRQFHPHVEPVPLAGIVSEETKTHHNHKMLVIGQKHIYNDHVTIENYAKIIEKLKSIAKENDVISIDYLPHPRRKAMMELCDPSFNCLETNESSEMIVMQSPYQVIASFSSTALIFSKLLSGNNTKVVSVGTNLSQRMDVIQVTIQLMKGINIEIIDV